MLCETPVGQQCEELLLHGVLREKDLESCSGEFARELQPHIAELQEDYAIHRERTTFENEAQATYLQSLDLSQAAATAQKACEQMLQEQHGDREGPGDAGTKRGGGGGGVGGLASLASAGSSTLSSLRYAGWSTTRCSQDFGTACTTLREAPGCRCEGW